MAYPRSAHVRFAAAVLGAPNLACAAGQSPTGPAQTWDVTKQGNILAIAYGSGTSFPQYAAFDTNSGYVRMVYSQNAGWGTSAVLLPSYWSNNVYYQGGTTVANWTVQNDGTLSISFTGTPNSHGVPGPLSASGQLILHPPQSNQLTAEVFIDSVTGTAAIDSRPNEAFKPVMFSSMYDSASMWDAQSAYAGSQTYALPQQGGWIVSPPVSGTVFGLVGGTSGWKTNGPTIEITLDESRTITGMVTADTNPNDDNVAFWADSDTLLNSWSYTIVAKQPALRFVPVTPCRIVDTRNWAGPFGGPTMTAGSTRSFAVPQSACPIPITAQAYSLNVTVVPQGPLGYLSLWPTGQTQPYVSTLNSWGGGVVANAAIVPAGNGGSVSVFVSNPSDVILDINGYFDSTTGASASWFYPATPCRVADTRNANGLFGGPSMTTRQTRDFPIPQSSCGIPSTASAYAVNVTVVPSGVLGYLTTWPTGLPLPVASTLNSWTGRVVANAAIVPAGTNESISVFVTDPTDVILDINGYFGPSGSAGALSFYSVTPCRVADTRNANGPFGGPEMGASSTRSFAIPSSGCGVPATAAAYPVNVTVVPDGVLGYLTVWPTGATQPYVSTLNSWDGSVAANAAIVPAGTDAEISIYVTHPTHVVLDINGYFAP
jgi:hypothetical protein